jgi:Ca2+/Na+ antiporter
MNISETKYSIGTVLNAVTVNCGVVASSMALIKRVLVD